MAHHGTERPWVCNQCPKNYKTNIDLLQHQRSHQPKGILKVKKENTKMALKCSPPKCTICSKVFNRKSGLNRHVMSFHIKLISCDICHKTFGENYELQRHRKLHFEAKRPVKEINMQTISDDDEVVENGKKRFRCGICKNTFCVRKTLRNHRKTVHENERVFMCEICSNMFCKLILFHL